MWQHLVEKEMVLTHPRTVTSLLVLKGTLEVSGP